MTPSAQLTLDIGAPPPYRNQYLFSDHYLDNLLPLEPCWPAALDAALAFAEWLRALYAKEQTELPHYSEAQLEEHWIKPILIQLGHVFEPQPAVPGLEQGIQRPDYAFFPDEAARQAAVSAQKTGDYAAHALAVGEAKAWEVALGKKQPGSGGAFAAQNPGWQIDYYLRATGLDWGILTNGRRWRLVNQVTSFKLAIYYEVDLLDLLAREDAGLWRYFLLFFRPAAFRPEASGRSFLDAALAASTAYALALEEDLRENAYHALERLIQGFLTLPDNAITQDDLPEIYTNSLYLLYRLLFVLYGESHGLLPLNNPYYAPYSLTRLKQEIAALRVPMATRTQQYWCVLKELFTIIGGEEASINRDLYVPRYNGGLFSAHQHPFLVEKAVGDRDLVAAIELLSRRDTPTGREFVDYRTLGVRHLGSIYEGLLEYQPRVADAPLVAVSDGRHERWLTAAETPAANIVDRRQPGEVYLATDKGERKATGSYYTPQYIVEYIVEQTLGPLIEGIKKQEAGSKHPESRIANRVSSSQSFSDSLLSLKILDPSMGSGHFLVATLDYLARALATDPDVETTAPGEEDLTYWRRRVVERCIYGVDRNPLAVELAKLSLWLATVAADKPLSFLDHHLKCGDSLVGATVADLGNAPAAIRAKKRGRNAVAEGQMNLFAYFLAQQLPVMLSKVLEITGVESDSYETVQAKDAADQAVRALKAPFEAVAHLWLSAQFGHTYPPEDYVAAQTLLTQREMLLALPAVQRARQIAQERRFFHWELAFPEVFYDEYGRSLEENAGFDAILGNPPYVRQEELTLLKSYFAARYPRVYAGTADLFVYFFGQGLNLLRQGGRLSYISSNSWLRANYATALRAYLRQHTTIETLVDLGDNAIFADAPDVYPAIHVVRREPPPAEHLARAAVFGRGEDIARFKAQLVDKLFPVAIHDQPDSGWVLVTDRVRGLFERMKRHSRTLEDIVAGKIYRGISTGYNTAFVIDQKTRDRLIASDPQSEEIIKPILNGAGLRPWYQAVAKEWLIFTRRGIDIDHYPAIKAYLEPFREQLSPQPADWDNTKEWAGRKPGAYEWYEIQDAVDYFTEFERPKIFWPDITKYPRFSWDTSGYYLRNTGYMAVTDEIWLLGDLASRCAWFCISHLSIPFGERAGLPRYRLIDQYMRPLPVPDAPPAARAAIADLATRLTELARNRHTLHTQMRHRILTDLGKPGSRLNQALTAWWELDFPAFRAEVQKTLKRAIPLKERADWEAYLQAQQAKHQRLTAEIVRLETELNAHVYALFDLTPEEIALVEESTKYKYGEA